MSTYVVGFIPPDARYIEMKLVWDTCKSLKIEPPDEVEDFFDGRDPCNHGMEIVIPSKEWTANETQTGLEINVEQIPKSVKVIRFVNSY